MPLWPSPPLTYRQEKILLQRYPISKLWLGAYIQFCSVINCLIVGTNSSFSWLYMLQSKGGFGHGPDVGNIYFSDMLKYVCSDCLILTDPFCAPVYIYSIRISQRRKILNFVNSIDHILYFSYACTTGLRYVLCLGLKWEIIVPYA